MIFRYTKNLLSSSNNKILFLLITFFISRYIVYFDYILPKEIIWDESFLTALNENFFEYFIYFHSLPLGNIIIAKIYLHLSNIFEIKSFYYLLNCSYSLFSFIIIYNLYLKIFKKINILIYFLFFFYVLAIIPYETWRLTHHDHINVFLFSYLMYFCYNFIFLENKNNYHFFIILFLFVLFYSSGLIILLETLLVVFFFNYIKKKRLEKKMIFYIISILLINSFVLLKNNYNIKQTSPTSVMNAVLLQKVHHALGDEKYKTNLKNTDLSIFLKKCIKNIYTNKTDDINHFENITLFKCFLDKKNNIYNYKKIIKLLKESNASVELINQVKKDLEERSSKPWKFSGPRYLEYNDRTNHIFQLETKKIFLNSFINYPYEMLIGKIGSKGFLLTFIQTGSWGALHPNYYEQQHKLNNLFFDILTILFAIINISFIFYFVLFSLIKILFKKDFEYMNNKTFQYNIIILFFIGSFLFINSNVTCCENPRMTVMIYFLFMINSLINITNLINEKSLIKNVYN